jgi:hypothetical protein
MIVRIRLTHAHAVRRRTIAFNRQAALMASTLMTPLALMAWALAGWRLLADLNIAGRFAISEGLFSRWQVWTVIAIVLQFAAFLLHRLAKDRDYDSEVS